MKKNYLRLPAILFYIIAVCCISIYGYFSLNPMLLVSPTARLVLLGLTCVAIYLGSLLISKTVPNKQVTKIMKITFLLFFIIYIFLLVTLTLFDQYFGRSGVNNILKWDSDLLNNYIKHSVNIVPFTGIIGYIKGFFTGSMAKSVVITNIIGNIVAFMPFALFLPFLFNKMKSFKWFISVMCAVVLSVELLQILMLTGTCDIDDIIVNVDGACMAFGILHIAPIKNIINKITGLSY